MKTFEQLVAEIAAKSAANDPGSGTVKALAAGTHFVGKKVVEEAAESWMAAEHEGTRRAAEEISQLLYWTAVLMASAGVSLEDVYGEL